MLTIPTIVVIAAVALCVETSPPRAASIGVETNGEREDMRAAFASLMRQEATPAPPTAPVEATPNADDKTASLPTAAIAAPPEAPLFAPVPPTRPGRVRAVTAAGRAKVAAAQRPPMRVASTARTRVARGDQRPAPVRVLAGIRGFVASTDKRVSRTFASLGEKLNAFVRKL